jgi:hypothetical protein
MITTRAWSPDSFVSPLLDSIDMVDRFSSTHLDHARNLEKANNCRVESGMQGYCYGMLLKM